MTTMQSPTPREMAREMLARATAGVDDPAAAGIAMQRLCTRVSESLCRFIGDDGYNALLARVLTRTEAAHPALHDVRRVDGGRISLERVVASVDAHGVPAVTEALEALLASLVDILGGLIGADMVRNLLDHDSRPSPSSNGRHP